VKKNAGIYKLATSIIERDNVKRLVLLVTSCGHRPCRASMPVHLSDPNAIGIPVRQSAPGDFCQASN